MKILTRLFQGRWRMTRRKSFRLRQHWSLLICSPLCIVSGKKLESALQFLFTNTNDNNIQGIGLKRKSKFEINDDGASSSEDVVKCKRVESIVVNKKFSKVDNVVTSESTIDEYELGDFSITDTGVINFDGDLMFQ